MYDQFRLKLLVVHAARPLQDGAGTRGAQSEATDMDESASEPQDGEIQESTMMSEQASIKRADPEPCSPASAAVTAADSICQKTPGKKTASKGRRMASRLGVRSGGVTRPPLPHAYAGRPPSRGGTADQAGGQPQPKTAGRGNGRALHPTALRGAGASSGVAADCCRAAYGCVSAEFVDEDGLHVKIAVWRGRDVAPAGMPSDKEGQAACAGQEGSQKAKAADGGVEAHSGGERPARAPPAAGGGACPAATAVDRGGCPGMTGPKVLTYDTGNEDKPVAQEQLSMPNLCRQPVGKGQPRRTGEQLPEPAIGPSASVAVFGGKADGSCTAAKHCWQPPPRGQLSPADAARTAPARAAQPLAAGKADGEDAGQRGHSGSAPEASAELGQRFPERGVAANTNGKPSTGAGAPQNARPKPSGGPTGTCAKQHLAGSSEYVAQIWEIADFCLDTHMSTMASAQEHLDPTTKNTGASLWGDHKSLKMEVFCHPRQLQQDSDALLLPPELHRQRHEQ